jgi:hypothetical protein
MLRIFRVRAWCLATALSIATGTAGTSLDLLLHDDTAHHADPCIGAPPAVHHAASHVITARDADPADEANAHCVACHLARATRLRAETDTFAARPEDASKLRGPTSIGVALAPPLANLQPRSPPRAA